MILTVPVCMALAMSVHVPSAATMPTNATTNATALGVATLSGGSPLSNGTAAAAAVALRGDGDGHHHIAWNKFKEDSASTAYFATGPVFKCLTDASCRDGGGLARALQEAGVVLAQAAVSAVAFAIAGPMAAALSSSLLSALLGSLLGSPPSDQVTRNDLKQLQERLRSEMQQKFSHALRVAATNQLIARFMTHTDKVGDFMTHAGLARNMSAASDPEAAAVRYCLADFTLLTSLLTSVDELVNTFEANYAELKPDTAAVRFALGKISAAIGAYTAATMHSVTLCYGERETLHHVAVYEDR